MSIDQRAPAFLHEINRGLTAAVQIHRTDHCLADVAQDVVVMVYVDAFGHDVTVQSQLQGHFRHRFLADERHKTLRQAALRLDRKHPVDHFRHRHAENTVAQKLQTFIIFRQFSGFAGMRQRLMQQMLIVEMILQIFFQFFHDNSPAIAFRRLYKLS